MKTEEQKQIDINILNLLCNNIIVRFEKLEAEGFIFHKQKQIGKSFIRELSKITNVILDVGKETDEKAYNAAINEMHLIDEKLNDFLEKLY